MNDLCNKLDLKINSNFISSDSLFCGMREWYKKKNYNGALLILEDTLRNINIDSKSELSNFYDLAASILWKIGEKNEAHKLWQKSYNFDSNNRHTLLSLKILFNENVNYSYFFELFIKIKYNEYFSLKEEKEENCCLDFFEEDKVLNYLITFWEKNLSSKNLDEMDELELVDYFINLEVF
ncbi:MAG TPA: hypothetical protein PK771_15895 [Spirochaetota bacterium]|nr:hypothetical protein [Spirochaetota bacterium]